MLLLIPAGDRETSGPMVSDKLEHDLFALSTQSVLTKTAGDLARKLTDAFTSVESISDYLDPLVKLS